MYHLFIGSNLNCRTILFLYWLCDWTWIISKVNGCRASFYFSSIGKTCLSHSKPAFRTQCLEL